MKTRILFTISGFFLGLLTTFLYKEFFVFENEVGVSSAFVNYFTLDSKSSISCTYPQVLIASYENNSVNHRLPKPETNPMVFTFSKFNEGESGLAELSYVDATESISTVPVAIIHEDDEKIILIESSGDTYATLHTIYKKHGVAIFSKQILFPFIDTPIGTMGMGTCR